ncbi:hypothetical protein EVAR_102460_1 [Eumeta japonica]|uniref:Uncharacterized protein n=1 Tax=Eumeta variegata TaxID=151549 RepID=A0A4C1ZSX6_EUMVA|nr:hypothetical protein EVAR_102460_1 [Eumeta japonica]
MRGEKNYQNNIRKPGQDPKRRKQKMKDVTSTRTILGHFDVPEKLRRFVRRLKRDRPRDQNYAEAAARPKPLAAAQDPRP